MGLAASQARLLTITARLADNELRSQTINNAKMRLATESSQASENYVNALNDAVLKFSNYNLAGESQSQALSFNALTAYSSYNTQYGLVNSSGQLLVSEEEAAIFEKSNEDLDTYLQYHGLTYDTTYFEEVGEMTNIGYPEPFDYLSVEEMEEIYKNYNSLANSQEVEDFNNAYNQYVSKEGSLESAGKTILKEYFTGTNGVSNPLTYSGSTYSFATALTGNLQEQVNTAKYELLTNSNNPYSLANLVNMGILDTSSQEYTDYLEILDGISASGDTYTNTITDSVTGIAETDSDGNTTGNYVYTIDNIKIIVDPSGNVTGDSDVIDDGKSDSDPDTNYNVYGIIAGLPLEETINNMYYTSAKSDGTIIEKITYNATKDTSKENTYNITSTTKSTVSSNEERTSIITELINELLQSMHSDLAINFAQAAYGDANDTADDNTTLINDYYQKTGNSLSDYVTGTTKTLETFYKEYCNAEEDYVRTVFSGSKSDSTSAVAFVIDLLDNETIPINYTETDGSTATLQDDDGNDRALTYKDLTDIDFLLRFIDANGLEMSAGFETVAKEYIMDNIIAEYGTPKYAWQDSTDTNNTGNADAKAQWYTNLFNRMMQGYKVLENGLAASNEWIEYALESGIVTMEQVDASYEWQGLDYKSCAKITEETDDAAVTKAEAEYNRAMNDIESKDSIYDIELKNIDTEHSSLQTEYESIKGVISKNVERTFNFYKNA